MLDDRTKGPTSEQVSAAADLFRSLSDPSRLRLLLCLTKREMSVGELAELQGERIGTMSARLKVLLSSRLVRRRRSGQQMIYAIADHHVMALVDNGIEHACEAPMAHNEDRNREAQDMTDHKARDPHPHQHDEECGHTAVRHNGHVDYLHDGHLHHPHNGHVDEHALDVNAENPERCTPGNHAGHDPEHVHGPDCGHEAIPHGNHVDYIVDGRLHHPHGDHCDDHGPVEIVTSSQA